MGTIDTQASEMKAMKIKRSIRQFENDLEGMSGGISLYRKGIDEFCLSQYHWIYEQLEAARRDLEAIGMYEHCRDALTQAEVLIRKGPEHDEDAYMLMLNALRALSQASGTLDEMSQKLKANPNATVDDFKPDPDGWAQEEQEENKKSSRA